MVVYRYDKGHKLSYPAGTREHTEVRSCNLLLVHFTR